MMNTFRVKVGGLLLAAPLLLFSACGAAGPAKATAGPPTKTAAAPLDPQIVTHSASARVQVGQPLSVSASCKSGEQMIGGGFDATNLFEYAAYIEASYPSGANTWTVTGKAPASYFDLSAEVYCVAAPVSLGIQIVKGTGARGAAETADARRPQAPVAAGVDGAGGLVSCPEGTRLLSGGFQGSRPVAASYPVENGWSSASSDQVYALCAGQHVTAGSVVTLVFSPRSSANGDQPGGAVVSCPAGQFAAGGGFASQGALIVSSTRSGPPSPGWSVSAGSDSKVTVYAFCAVLHG